MSGHFQEGMTTFEKVRAVVVMVVLFIVLPFGSLGLCIYDARFNSGGQGDTCEDHSDCNHGHQCSQGVFGVEQSVCRKGCEEDKDCPSQSCRKVLNKPNMQPFSYSGLCE